MHVLNCYSHHPKVNIFKYSDFHLVLYWVVLAFQHRNLPLYVYLLLHSHISRYIYVRSSTHVYCSCTALTYLNLLNFTSIRHRKNHSCTESLWSAVPTGYGGIRMAVKVAPEWSPACPVPLTNRGLIKQRTLHGTLATRGAIDVAQKVPTTCG